MSWIIRARSVFKRRKVFKGKKRYGTSWRSTRSANKNRRVYFKKRGKYGKSSFASRFKKRTRSYASRGKNFVRKFTLRSSLVNIAYLYIFYAFISIVRITKDTGVSFVEAIKEFLDDWLDFNGDGERQWYEFTMAQWLFIIIVGLIIYRTGRK